jgi:hypothetical protein
MQTVIGTCLLHSQCPPACQSQALAVFGIGGPVPKIPLEIKRLSPRERALLAFAIEATGFTKSPITAATVAGNPGHVAELKH